MDIKNKFLKEYDFFIKSDKELVEARKDFAWEFDLYVTDLDEMKLEAESENELPPSQRWENFKKVLKILEEDETEKNQRRC